jgi:outer membrane autotransporter protein
MAGTPPPPPPAPKGKIPAIRSASVTTAAASAAELSTGESAAKAAAPKSIPAGPDLTSALQKSSYFKLREAQQAAIDAANAAELAKAEALGLRMRQAKLDARHKNSSEGMQEEFQRRKAAQADLPPPQRSIVEEKLARKIIKATSQDGTPVTSEALKAELAAKMLARASSNPHPFATQFQSATSKSDKFDFFRDNRCTTMEDIQAKVGSVTIKAIAETEKKDRYYVNLKKDGENKWRRILVSDAPLSEIEAKTARFTSFDIKTKQELEERIRQYNQELARYREQERERLSLAPEWLEYLRDNPNALDGSPASDPILEGIKQRRAAEAAATAAGSPSASRSRVASAAASGTGAEDNPAVAEFGHFSDDLFSSAPIPASSSSPSAAAASGTSAEDNPAVAEFGHFDDDLFSSEVLVPAAPTVLASTPIVVVTTSAAVAPAPAPAPVVKSTSKETFLDEAQINRKAMVRDASLLITHRIINQSYARLGSKRAAKYSLGIATGEVATPINQNFWLEMFSSHAKQGKTSTYLGDKTKAYGGLIGADNTTDDLTLGLAFGFADTEIKANSTLLTSKLKTKSYELVSYGEYDFGNDYFMEGSLTIGWHRYNTYQDRPRLVVKRFKSTGTSYTADIGFGRTFLLNNGLDITPKGAIRYTYLHLDKPRDDATISQGKTSHHNIVKIGGILGYTLPSNENGYEFRPEVYANILYNLSNKDEQYIIYKSTAGTYRAKSNFPRESYNFGGSITLLAKEGLAVTLKGDVLLNTKKYREYTGSVRVKYQF